MTSLFTEEPRIDLITPRLYHEDLELIARLVHDACDGQIEIDMIDKRGFHLIREDLSCFTEHYEKAGTAKRLKVLTISGTPTDTNGKKTPAIVVSFSLGGANLVLNNPDKAVRGAASQIRDLCEKRSRKSRMRRTFLGPGLVFALMLLYTAAAGLHTFINFALDGSVNKSSMEMLAWVPASGVVWLLLRWSRDDAGWPKLVNVPRVQRPWQQHRRDVTYLLIGWFLGACTSYWVNQIPPLPPS